MKKYLFSAAALVLLATMLFGCGMKNVSEQPNGKVTEPTATTPTIIPEPTLTMPTDGTAPATDNGTDPSRHTETTHTVPDGTTGTNPSERTAGRQRPTTGA